MPDFPTTYPEPTLRTATTDKLSARLVRRIRVLLETAFEGAFTDDDWEHAVGGVHAWVAGPEGPLSHGAP
ncbi:MAG: hypothetical protein VYE68_10765, partial [Acidobacteriota bacterium]|nr:hypothetical protein [Acidobacteriota bacterium]